MRELRAGRRYATDGIGPDLLVAGGATPSARMIDWLGREHGLTPIHKRVDFLHRPVRKACKS